MADLKTTQETARSSIDGTELVRLATTGANWKATLADIFAALGGGGGGGSPGSPHYALQFNNPLGTFDGDAVALFDPSVGVTLGGATVSGGVVTRGSGTHMALGNYAVIDTITSTPGDPANESTAIDRPVVLSIAEFVEGDLTLKSVSGVMLETCSKHIGTGTFLGSTGFQIDNSISSESTGDISDIRGMFGGALNYGAGSVNNMTGMEIDAFHNGAGTLSGTMKGIRVTTDFWNNNAGMITGDIYNVYASTENKGGTVNDQIGFSSEMQLLGSGSTTNRAIGFYFKGIITGTPTSAYGVYISTPWSAVNTIGMLIEDCSVWNTGASGNSYNLWSQGSHSTNIFEGYIEQVETSTPPSGVANHALIFTEDNGSGKTRLMVKFGTGAAQQIAIEP